ncbi:MAG: hypothetical protein WBP41_09880, partial [Saprospiraceae bacterium]
FTITSAVNNGSGIYSYQWQSGTTSTGPWTNITVNGDLPDYTDILTSAGIRYYRVIVDDLASGCGIMTSAAISITVNSNPTVSVSPAGQTVCIGGPATLTATVLSGSGNFQYQWEQSPDGSSWSNVASGGNAVTYNPPTGALTSTYYRVWINDIGSGCADLYSASVFVNVHDQPTVSIAVDNPIICVGGSAVISPTILNGSGTYAYQWQQSANGTSGWSNVAANGTNATYNVPSASPGSLFYRLILSDIGSGCADPISNNVNVTVQSPPTVTVAATGSVICIGGSSTVNSTVLNGSGFYSYQWQSSPTGAGGTWSNITNQGNGANYAAPSAVPGTTFYRVIVTDAGSGCGSSVSNAVSVIIVNQPSVTISVNNPIICIGGTSTITSTITNGSGSYAFQWQSSPTGNNPWTNTGTNSSALNLTGTVAGTTYYRVIVDDLSNGCNNPVSSSLSVVVQSGPTVTLSADQDSVCLFGAVEITPTILNGSGLYNYVWQSSASSGGPWSTISGASNPTYTPSTATAGVTWYRVMITDLGSGCNDPVSNGVRIAVYNQPTLSIQLAVPVVCVGGVALITSNITNGSGLFSYQWQVSPDGSSGWTNIASGGNGANYNVPTTGISSSFYRLILTDNVANCDDPQSNNIQVNVVSPSNVTINAPDDTVCIGAITIITSTITGGSGIFTYQWQQSLNGTTGWANVPANGTNPTYTVPTLVAQRFYYRLVLTDQANGCADPISAATPVTVQSDPILNASANNPILCIGGSSVISTTVTGGSGDFSYQWQTSPNGTSGWGNVASGGTGPTYNVPTGTVGTFYYRIILIDNANGCDDPAPVVVSIQVNSQPAVTISATNTNLCIGGSSTINSTVTNGSGFLTYQWQSSPNGSTWSNIASGGTGASYAVPTGSPNSTFYRVLVTDAGNGCNDPVSNTVQVVVQSQPTVTIAIDNPVVCVTGSALITSTILNGTNLISYQWQSSPNGSTGWVNITVNGNAATYVPLTNLAGTTYYRVIVTDAGNGCNDPVSSSVQLIVQPQPTVSIAVNNALICVGGSSTISSTISNGSGLFNYQWQSGTSGSGPWTDITLNGTSATYDVPSATSGSFFYRLIVTDQASGCNDPLSNVINVVISPDLSVTTQPTNVIECIGGTSTMTVVVTGGSGTLSYQWQSSP